MSQAATMEADRGSPGSRTLLRKVLLLDAEARALRVGDDRRRELRLLMVLVRQKADSASALWAVEQYVEALRLVQEAIAETRRVVRMANVALSDTSLPGNGDPNVPAEDDAPDWVSMLGPLGARTYELEEMREVTLGPPQPVPVLNSQVTEKHRAFFRTAIVATQSALRRIEPIAATPGTFVARRWLRLGLALLVLVGIVLPIALRPPRPPVEASDQLRDEFSAARVLDGDPTTEWLLPNHTAGWIRVSFAPRPLKAVKLLNCHNRGFNDRATNQARVEVFLAGKKVHTSIQTFGPAVNPTPEWVRLPVEVAQADSILVLVDSYNNMGGGLAEITWE